MEQSETLWKRYSDVNIVPVQWVWYPYIALGKITWVQGDPGDGKSTMMLAKLTARVRELSSEISHIRSEYPYTMKEFLEDEEAVEARRSELQKQL